MKTKPLMVVAASAFVLMSSVNQQNYKAIGQASNEFGVDYLEEAKEGKKERKFKLLEKMIFNWHFYPWLLLIPLIKIL